MQSTAQSDALILGCIPLGIVELEDIDLGENGLPDDLAFCCFFRSLEQRSRFLMRLREIAGGRLRPGANRDALGRELTDEFVALAHHGQAEEAMFVLIRWRTQVLGQGYHSYNLVEGVPPYRTGCFIAFDELPAETIRRYRAQALHHVNRQKDRILDAFGFGGLQ